MQEAKLIREYSLIPNECKIPFNYIVNNMDKNKTFWENTRAMRIQCRKRMLKANIIKCKECMLQKDIDKKARR